MVFQQNDCNQIKLSKVYMLSPEYPTSSKVTSYIFKKMQVDDIFYLDWFIKLLERVPNKKPIAFVGKNIGYNLRKKIE